MGDFLARFAMLAKACHGAKSQASHLDTNVERYETTNEQGVYSFPGLRPGHYSVECEKQGF